MRISTTRLGLQPESATRVSLAIRRTGNALLVHLKGQPDARAVGFGARLVADRQHELVLVDLPFGILDDAVAALVKLLAAATRGSLRIVFGRATAYNARQVGQQIAEALGRLVMVADGEVQPTAHGGLFVPSDRGAGWLRFWPGRAAERDSRRFPKPLWEFFAADHAWRIGTQTVVEPLPSGLWVRSAGPGTESDRRWLIDRLPPHPKAPVVVVGNAAGPPIDLEDIGRLWQTVVPSARSWVRFLHYGPVTLQGTGGGLGQELADLLDEQVVVYGGMPVDHRDGFQSPQVRAMTAEAALTRRPYVSELMYFPRKAGTAPPPALFGVRNPIPGFPEIGHGTYEYAADAVLEVVPSGLWLRPPEEPADGDAVRSISAGHAAILYQEGSPEVTARMRALAEDMLARLEPEEQSLYTVAPANGHALTHLTAADGLWAPVPVGLRPSSTAVTGPRPAYTAPWSVEPPTAEHTRAEAAGILGPGTSEAPYPATGRAAAAVDPAPYAATDGSTVHAPILTGHQQRQEHSVPLPDLGVPAVEPNAPDTSRTRTESEQDHPAADVTRAAESAEATTASRPPSVPGLPAGADPAPPTAATTGQAHREAVPPTATGVRPDATAAEPRAQGPQPPQPVPAQHAPLPAQQAVPARPEPTTTSAAELEDHGKPLGPDRSSPPQAGPGPRPVMTIRLESTPPTPDPGLPPRDRPAPEAPSTQRVPTPLASSVQAPVRPPVQPGASAVEPNAGGVVPAAFAEPPTQVRVQPVPGADATAVPPATGVEKEREWLRRTFNARYNAVAGTISRVMSESPGLRLGGTRPDEADALTDLVAVRLYLSGDRESVDAEIRAGRVGPHVPLARCVATGLRRLPSYRGATRLEAPLSEAERSWFTAGRLLTEWAFCDARTTFHEAAEESTEFLIWSMTARRTQAVDPVTSDRVLFLPGTVFKVIREGSETSPVLMRELAPSENGMDGIGGERVPLDDIALDGLERAYAARVPPDPSSGSRGRSAPGLITG